VHYDSIAGYRLALCAGGLAGLRDDLIERPVKLSFGEVGSA